MAGEHPAYAFLVPGESAVLSIPQSRLMISTSSDRFAVASPTLDGRRRFEGNRDEWWPERPEPGDLILTDKRLFITTYNPPRVVTNAKIPVGEVIYDPAFAQAAIVARRPSSENPMQPTYTGANWREARRAPRGTPMFQGDAAPTVHLMLDAGPWLSRTARVGPAAIHGPLLPNAAVGLLLRVATVSLSGAMFHDLANQEGTGRIAKRILESRAARATVVRDYGIVLGPVDESRSPTAISTYLKPRGNAMIPLVPGFEDLAKGNPGPPMPPGQPPASVGASNASAAGSPR
jgi:hypothetical protein